MSPEAAELEKQIVAVWQDVLGLGSLPSDITFFEAGGTSLLAARLACRLETALQRRVSAADLFVYPTPRDLARSLAGVRMPAIPTRDPDITLGANTGSDASDAGTHDRAALQRGAFASFRPAQPGMRRA
ncbi:MAG: acyl carrier protein [Acidobacteriaceae bacterium]